MSPTNGFVSIDITDKAKDAAEIRQGSVQDADFLSMDEQRRKRFSQDTHHRSVLVQWMIWLVSIWLFLVLFAVILNKPLRLYIESGVLYVLLATTTINVLGLANIILSGLFGSRRTSFKNRLKKN